MSRFLYFLFLLLFLESCFNEKKGSNDEIVVELNAHVKDTLAYSSFVDSIGYISLQTTEECLIGRIKDVIISDDYILVLDGKLSVVWIFDKDGQYLTCIDKKGAGPEEYMVLSQFDYDKLSKQILLLDTWTQSILFFDVNGVFVKKVKLSMNASDFIKLSDNSFLLSRAGEVDDASGVFLADSLGCVTKNLVKRNSNHLFPCTFDWEFSTFNDTISFMAPNLENVVYHYVSGSLSQAFPLTVNPESSKKYTPDSSLQSISDFSRTDFIESSKWIFASYWSSEFDLRILFYSKEQRLSLVGKNTKNDLDGVDYDGKTSASDNNTFTFWCRGANSDSNPILQILYLK